MIETNPKTREELGYKPNSVTATEATELIKESLRTLTPADLEDIRLIVRQEVHADTDIIFGIPNILVYVGLSRRSLGTFYKWMKRYGLPASKDPNGRWWMSKRLMDQWMYSRHLMMSKAMELGIRCSGRGRHGKTYPNPEIIPEGERARVIAAINEDRCK